MITANQECILGYPTLPAWAAFQCTCCVTRLSSGSLAAVLTLIQSLQLRAREGAVIELLDGSVGHAFGRSTSQSIVKSTQPAPWSVQICPNLNSRYVPGMPGRLSLRS